MPRNTYFRRKIRKIELAHFNNESSVNSDSDVDRPIADSELPRCSTPIAPWTLSDAQTSPPSSSNDGYFLEDTEGEWPPGELLQENVLSESDNDESCAIDDTEKEEAIGDVRLWQKVFMNESCKLSVNDLHILLAAMQCAYKLPDNAMNAYCKLLLSCLPNGHSAPTCYSNVVTQLFSNFGDIDQTINYVCSAGSCQSTLKQLFDSCSNANCELFDKKQHATGFLRLAIRPQIERIIRSHLDDIYRYLASTPYISDTEFGDIPSTPAYAALGPNPDGNTIFINLILSSDGAQAFKLNRSSFWPCVAIISELPPTVRVAAENAIGLGFWVGRGDKTKPDWNLFLPAIISDLNLLKDGFQMEIDGRALTICVRLFATIFDLPAQASIWGTKQFNGNYGCIRCMHPGQRSGTVCLWPSLEEPATDKDEEFYENAWRQLLIAPEGSDYFGVKAISPLSRICNPARVNIFDSMHLIYRGNGLLILNRLFTSQAHKWSAIFGKRLLLELNSVVSDIRFPYYFDRKIPNLCSIGNFKASEVKNLLLYAILPITIPYMDDCSDHWHWIAIYVHSIRLLSQPILSVKDVEDAKRLLLIWQKLIPDLCHESSQNFNSHAVLHLPDQVKQFGPLWSISTFAFEGFNGHFSRFIKASKGALIQLGRRFVLQQLAYKHLSRHVAEQKQPLASIAQELFPNLCRRWLPRNENSRYRLRAGSSHCHDPAIMETLHHYFPNTETSDFQFDTRASCGSEILHSRSYSSRTASVVKYLNIADDLGESYGEIDLFFSVREDIYAYVRKFRVFMPTNILKISPPSHELLRSFYDDRVYGSFFYIGDFIDEFDIVMLTDILCNAVLIVDCHGTKTVTDVLPFEHD